jgi:hypothetical protein
MFNHHKVGICFRAHMIKIRALKKETTMKLTATMLIMKMEAALTKIMEITTTMARLTTRMAPLYLQSPHLNKLILKLKNLRRPGTQSFLESLAIRT